MAQEILRNHQTDTCARCIAWLDKVLPVKVAFWLKLGDEANWYLYGASEKVTGDTIREDYEQVVSVSRRRQEPFLNLFDVKLLWADDPVATAVLEIQQRHQSTAIARFFQDRYLGGVVAEGLFIDPSKAAVPSP